MSTLINLPENENWYEYLLKKKDRTILESALFYVISIMALGYLGLVLLLTIVYAILIIPVSVCIIIWDKVKKVIKNVNSYK